MARITIVPGRQLKEAIREWKYLMRDGRRLAAVFHDGDAELFAAAPSMLLALKYAKAFGSQGTIEGGEHHGMSVSHFIDAAIAKAETHS